MIVLAIAGLILAIVFIAVPALQRNSRDTQRKADIAAIESAIATYVGNNNGQVPVSGAELGTALEGINLKFYDAVDHSSTVPATSWTATPPESDVLFSTYATGSPVLKTATHATEDWDYVIFAEGAECQATANAQLKSVARATPTATPVAAELLQTGSARGYAIVYAIESDPNWICTDNAT